MSIRPVVAWVYDVNTMSVVRMTQPVIEAGSITIAGVMEVTGPLTDDELRAEPVPVSGAFYPETQPVSGSVGVNNFPATQPVSAVSLPLPAGASTAASQTALEALIDTLQELVQRLAPLASAMNLTGGIGLKVVAGQTLAVSGPMTSAQSIAEKNIAGVSYPQRVAVENLTAYLSNIANCTAA